MMRYLTAAAMAAALAILPIGASTQAPAADELKVDAIFARWGASSPGCAVGASVNGTRRLAKAYGMADLEHDVRNEADTIFEAGSVSKQFTAAAVLLLAREGKLSLDDPARKYLPELPEYGRPLTIRHLLTHTSGLRDWGNVAAIGGWPRTSRVHTHAHVLDIVSRQRALNFTPGTRWSYSNTGYNLAAIIVSRVSGMPFAEFTRIRIFEPAGMTSTSWRDDYTRIVKRRAIAYDERPDGFHAEMPFENVHGNGGLLTTVGDLLKWNENFVAPVVGDASFVKEQQIAGRFSDGRPFNYALGLMLATYKGVPEVMHSGSTAGYRAFLTRYPGQAVSVAVLCNAAGGNATQYARAVADVYLGDRVKPTAPPSHTLTDAEIDARVGLYRNTVTGAAVKVVRENTRLRIEGGALLSPASTSQFLAGSANTWDIDGRGAARMTDSYGDVSTYERVAAARPTVDQLRELAGTYVSDEAEATFAVAVDGSSLVLKRRPDTTIKLTPLYSDAFFGSLGTVIFRRDGAGRPAAFSVSQDRVWDLRFTRQAQPARSSSQD